MSTGATASVPPTAAEDDAAIAKLGQLLLTIAGRDTNRLPSVVRHVTVLDAAIPYLSIEQAAEARRRIGALEDRWGRLLAGSDSEPENGGMSPEMRIDRWLSQRRYHERHLGILHHAAVAVWGGETSLSRIRDRAFRYQFDNVMRLPSLDAIKEWMIQLRIARREREGVYLPGSLCNWWVHDMNPEAGKGSAYAACLKRDRRNYGI
jgi:hypothetical protein